MRTLDSWIKSIVGADTAIIELLVNALKMTDTFPSSDRFPFWTGEGIDIVQCNRIVEMMSSGCI